MSQSAEKDAGCIDLAVDRDGNRYTTHTFGFDGDPWRGATILTPSVVRDLRERGMLPLTECPIPPAKPGEVSGDA